MSRLFCSNIYWTVQQINNETKHIPWNFIYIFYIVIKVPKKRWLTIFNTIFFSIYEIFLISFDHDKLISIKGQLHQVYLNIHRFINYLYASRTGMFCILYIGRSTEAIGCHMLLRITVCVVCHTLWTHPAKQPLRDWTSAGQPQISAQMCTHVKLTFISHYYSTFIRVKGIWD